MKDINEIFKIKIFGYKIHPKRLYKLIEGDFKNDQKDYDLTIDNSTILIQIEKINEQYKIKSNKDTITLFKKKVVFQNNEKINIHEIFCFENLLSLLNYYKFKSPYILNKSEKYKLNLELGNFPENFMKIKRLIIEEEQELYSNFLSTKEEFDLYKNSKTDLYNDKHLKIKDLGKYSSNYLRGIAEDETLFFLYNYNICKIDIETSYDGGTFNYLTGSEKGGKTFTLLYLNIFKENNYRIYINVKFFYELEENKEYQEMLRVFFYEISKIFKTYEEYEEFSKSFFEKLKETEFEEIKFKPLLFLFIDEVEEYALSHKYEKLMIIFDDYELDETKKELFQKNYNFINELYQKRKEKSFIHFSFVSLLNDNYIRDCVISYLTIKIDPFKIAYIKKDEITGKKYFPFIYIDNCFYESNKDLAEYKNKIKEKNNNECNISEKYLNDINYSLYHLNNIKNLNQKNINKKTFSAEFKNYIQSLKNEVENCTFDFYENNNLGILYAFDLDKIKEFHDLISKESVIKYVTLIDALKFIPIRFLSFYYLGSEIPKDYIYSENVELYKVLYRNKFYKDSISNYLFKFENACYEKKSIKPGEKGDLFEKRVIESIKNGYFENFKPEIIIEIDEIYSLCEYTEKNYSKYEKVIELFNELFSEGKDNLIMIIQKKPNAKRYDLAFLQKISKGKYQLILVQITTKKEQKDMSQYTEVKCDCYNLANFFAIFNDIVVDRYHFMFIFKGGLNEDKKSMEFCDVNDINYIKYCEKNKEQYFLDSGNRILKKIVFDDKNFSLVDCIKNRKLGKLDNLTLSSEYSLIGQKRKRINKISSAKYYLGINIYNVISAIFDKKNFELSEEFYSLEENKIFRIYIRHNSKNQKVYFLEYLRNGKKKIEIIKTNSSKTYKFDKKNNLNKEINKPGTLIKCFKLLDN